MLKLLRAYWVQALVFLLLLLVVFGINIAFFYTDLLWYREVGYESVLWKMLGTRLLLFLVFGAASFALAYINLRLAERFSPPIGINIPGEGPEGGDVFLFDREGRPRRAPRVNGRVVRTLSDMRRILQAVLGLGALGFAIVSGLTASGQWDSFLLFRNATAFGDASSPVVDPLFNKDIGFYVFTLPFLRYVQSWVMVVLLLVGAAVAVVYVFQRGIDTAAGRTFVAPHVRAHLSAIAALALLTQAFGYWLDRFELLQAGGHIFTGAGYTDVHARLPMLNVLVVVTLLAALAVLVNIRQRAIRLPLTALGLWLVASVLGVIIPGSVQATRVRPNETNLEAPYIRHAIKATRAAYNIDKVQVREFPVEQNLTTADLARNQATLRNIRLWDYEPLLETYPQQQVLRQYYAFPDVDVDRYRFGGGVGYRQVWLAAREIAPERLDARAQTWINQRLRYTHGFGVVMSPVNAFTDEGLPTFYLKNIPTESSVPGLTLTEPRIYYGQHAARASYVVVGTRQPEFDYPSDNAGGGSGSGNGGGDRENAYRGKGGVPLRGLAKLAFAWRFRDPTLLLTGTLTADSRLLFARRISDRVQRVAPFLRLDADPYPVISPNGRVVWMLDAYTTTDAYPYSAINGVRDARGMPLRLNYIRNSVKATVDAYDGTITLYAADDKDPILRTYRRIFPVLVKPMDQMPEGLRAHIRYPENLFEIQRRVLADYHVTEPQRFYSRDDSWDIARAQSDMEEGGAAFVPGAGTGVVAPYYVIMRLPEEQNEEFLLLSPFTPRNRQNMISLLAARCDPGAGGTTNDRYGELILYRFPPNRTVFGPQQINSLIQQDSRISPQLTLWNQQGSRVLRGNMLVVPIEKSLLYVQPLYLRAKTAAEGVLSPVQGLPMESAASSGQGAGIPALTRVIAAFENRVVMEGTLEEALRSLFAGRPGAPAAPNVAASGAPESRPPAGVAGTERDALIERAGAQYERADAALKRGDFAAYGQEIKALGETLRQLRAQQQQQQQQQPAGTSTGTGGEEATQ